MTRSEKIKTTGGTSTSLKVLARLVEDEEWIVRWNVAENTSTPLEVLAELSRYKDTDVRTRVALNPSTPPEVLLILMVDDHHSVRKQAERSLSGRIKP